MFGNADGAVMKECRDQAGAGRSVSLGHMPDGPWVFDEAVTAVFDDMLARSVPQIGAMRETILQISERCVQPDTYITDLGCARGETIAQLLQKFGRTNRFVGTDVSAPMLAACRERFRPMVQSGVVEIIEHDLKSPYPPYRSSLTLAVLTLMFTPVEARSGILRGVFEHTSESGGIVLVEKVLGSDDRLAELFRERHEAYKRGMGYSPESIARKRLSLEGVLIPLTAAENERLLRQAGFRHVECFWRCLNFCGWIAIRS